MDGRQGAEDDSGRAARRALEEALDDYVSGATDLESAARTAGMDTFDFLREAGALPDPAAVESDNELPTFVRPRRDDLR